MTKFLLKKMEFEMTRKEVELEMQIFDGTDALTLEYQKEAIDIKDLDSADDAAPSIHSRSSFKWKETRKRHVCLWLDRSDLPEKACNHNCERFEKEPENTYPRVTFDGNWSGKPRSSNKDRYGLTQYQEKFVYNKTSGSSQLPKVKLVLSMVIRLNGQSSKGCLSPPCSDEMFLSQRK